MSVHSIALVVHIAAGTCGLVLMGPVLLAPKRRGMHSALGRIYAGAALAMCASAVVLWSLDPVRLAGLGVLAAGTGAATTSGVLLAWRRPRGWYVRHLRLMGGSAIAFATGFAVQVSDGHLLAWIAPTLLGVPLVERRALVLTPR